ncbi:MAG: HAD family hydrolase [Actinomycetota bacterium]
MTNPSACAVFDIDDTLYLERDYVRSGFESVGRWVEHNLGLPGFFEDAWGAFERGARGRIFDLVLAARGIQTSPEVIGTLVDVYRTHRPTIELIPDARACLEAMQTRFALAIVTDGPLESQRAKVQALGTDRWVETTVLTAELGTGFAKPHERAFQLVEAASGWKGERCTYVADNPAKDFAGPKSLGWRTVRVRRPGALHLHRPSGADVDLELPDLSSLHAFLGVEGVPQWTS